MYIEDTGDIEFTVIAGNEDVDKRLDIYLAANPNIVSRNFAQNLIEHGSVLIDGKVASKNQRLKLGQVIDVTIPAPEPSEIVAESIPLDIRYEDNDLIVLCKPAGMVVHPAHGHTRGTLVNALLAHTKDLSGIGGVGRPGIIHRLDKDTSGLMIVAKSDQAHQKLSKNLHDRMIKRTYLTLVHGNFKDLEGTIDAAIGRSPKFRQKMAVMGTGNREAISIYRVLEQYKGYSLVEVQLKTGRTHQIRVHMKYIYHPVVGDQVYGVSGSKGELGLQRQFLHAYKLEFEHPITCTHMTFEDNLPDDLSAVLHKLKVS